MKKFIALTILFPAVILGACENNKLEDELFEKHVLINQNGFRVYELIYDQTNVSDTLISVSVSGSSPLNRDVKVSLRINEDTLKGYNWEKYRADESMYHRLLPAQCYDIDMEGIEIKAGTDYTSIPIRFYLDRIDKEEDYVLPISIASSTEYPVAEPDYSTILMNIELSNEFTGSYTLNCTLEEIGEDEKLQVVMSNRKLRVQENNSVSLYAGNIAENARDREDFRMTMVIDQGDSTLTFIPKYPDKMEIIADTPIMEGEYPRNRITIEKNEDIQNSHKLNVTTTFYVYYNYKDIRDPEDIREYRVEGSLYRTRTVYIK